VRYGQHRKHRNDPTVGNQEHYGKGGAERLLVRLLCVSEENRTASDERNAHSLALVRVKYEDMVDCPPRRVETSE